MPTKQAFPRTKSDKVFGRTPFRLVSMPVFPHDQQTLPLQIRTMREYAAKRNWTIVTQIKEVGSGSLQREQRETLIAAARRREIDVVLVWRLDRWGRSVADLVQRPARTSASRSRFRFAHRSTRSDHPCRSRYGRAARRVRRVRTRDSSRARPCRFGSRTAKRLTPR